MTYADFGSISSGTMRPEDLLPCFAWELRNLAKRAGRVREFKTLLNECDAIDFDSDYAADTAEDLVNDLSDALQEFSPPYAYFGSHPGDGADYGFWISETLDHDFEGLRVSDTSEIPAGYSGEILLVNDHGNMTLYRKPRRGKMIELWSLV